MSPAGKGSPGKGGKAPAGKAKGGKGGAARGSSVPRRAAPPNAAPQGQGSLVARAGSAQGCPRTPAEAERTAAPAYPLRQ